MDIRGVEKLGKAFTESTVFLDFALRCERSNMVGLTVDGWTRNRVTHLFVLWGQQHSQSLPLPCCWNGPRLARCPSCWRRTSGGLLLPKKKKEEFTCGYNERETLDLVQPPTPNDDQTELLFARNKRARAQA